MFTAKPHLAGNIELESTTRIKISNSTYLHTN